VTRRVRVLVSLAAGALLSPWLPLYVARTMTRAHVEAGGDVITHGWRTGSLPAFLDAMPYMRPEQSPDLYFALNLALAVVYAASAAWLVHVVLARAFVGRGRRDDRTHGP
jgi:hypothetical protein